VWLDYWRFVLNDDRPTLALAPRWGCLYLLLPDKKEAIVVAWSPTWLGSRPSILDARCLTELGWKPVRCAKGLTDAQAAEQYAKHLGDSDMVLDLDAFRGPISRWSWRIFQEAFRLRGLPVPPEPPPGRLVD
jgi:hypothetical protein